MRKGSFNHYVINNSKYTVGITIRPRIRRRVPSVVKLSLRLQHCIGDRLVRLTFPGHDHQISLLCTPYSCGIDAST